MIANGHWTGFESEFKSFSHVRRLDKWWSLQVITKFHVFQQLTNDKKYCSFVSFGVSLFNKLDLTGTTTILPSLTKYLYMASFFSA